MKTRKFERGGFATTEDSEANTDRLGDFIAALDRGPAAAPGRGSGAKPKVVTMEQVKKAGFSELRDYLNKQRGLKRRGVNPTLGGSNQAEVDAADKVDYAQVLQGKETGNTRGGPSYDSAGKPSNAGPDVLSSNYSRNTRTGATAKMLKDNAKKPMSKEDYMKSREQYKQAQDESAPSTFKKGGYVRSADGIAQRGKTRAQQFKKGGKTC